MKKEPIAKTRFEIEGKWLKMFMTVDGTERMKKFDRTKQTGVLMESFANNPDRELHEVVLEKALDELVPVRPMTETQYKKMCEDADKAQKHKEQSSKRKLKDAFKGVERMGEGLKALIGRDVIESDERGMRWIVENTPDGLADRIMKFIECFGPTFGENKNPRFMKMAGQERVDFMNDFLSEIGSTVKLIPNDDGGYSFTYDREEDMRNLLLFMRDTCGLQITDEMLAGK